MIQSARSLAEISATSCYNNSCFGPIFCARHFHSPITNCHFTMLCLYAHFCLFTCFPIPTWTVAVTRRLSASFVPSSILFRTTQHTLLYVHLNCNPKINGNLFDPVGEDVSITDVIVVVKMTLSSSSLVCSIRCTYDPFTGRTLWPSAGVPRIKPLDLHPFRRHHVYRYTTQSRMMEDADRCPKQSRQKILN